MHGWIGVEDRSDVADVRRQGSPERELERARSHDEHAIGPHDLLVWRRERARAGRVLRARRRGSSLPLSGQRGDRPLPTGDLAPIHAARRVVSNRAVAADDREAASRRCSCARGRRSVCPRPRRRQAPRRGRSHRPTRPAAPRRSPARAAPPRAETNARCVPRRPRRRGCRACDRTSRSRARSRGADRAARREAAPRVLPPPSADRRVAPTRQTGGFGRRMPGPTTTVTSWPRSTTARTTGTRSGTLPPPSNMAKRNDDTALHRRTARSRV